MSKSFDYNKKGFTDYIPYFFAGLFVVSVIVYVIFLFIPKSSELETKRLELQAGEIVDISNELSDNVDFDSLSYSVSDEKIATIDEKTGVLEAKASGKVTVTIKSDKNPLYEQKFIVTVESSGPWIKFNKGSYTCTEGSKVDVTVTYGGDILSIIDYSSSSTEIADLKSGTVSGKQLNCKRCMSLHLECYKEGEVTITGVANTGLSATASVNVKKKTEKQQKKEETKKTETVKKEETAKREEKPKKVEQANPTNQTNPSNPTSQDGGQTTTVEKGWIRFNKESMTCDVGESVDFMITVGGTTNLGISAISLDPSVGEIAVGTSSGAVTNCTDCRAMHVKCKKKGTVTLKATSRTGVEATATVTVNEPQGWITISNTNITCEEGQSVDVMIKTGGTTYPGIAGVSAVDTSIATIENGTTSGAVTNCTDCRAMHVVCKKAGTTKIKAQSATGATATANVTVTAGKGYVRFSKSVYTCRAGQTLYTMINTGGSGGISSVSSFRSTNKTVATLGDGYPTGDGGVAQTDCIDCRAVHIKCKKKGTATLIATSSTGATGTAVVNVTS